MRYALGDLLQVYTDPCRCGLPGIRFAIVGRTDDMLTVKGVNVYPQAIANVIARLQPRVTGVFRIVLDAPGPRVEPPLRIRLEHAGLGEEALAAVEKELLEQFRDMQKMMKKAAGGNLRMPPGMPPGMFGKM